MRQVGRSVWAFAWGLTGEAMEVVARVRCAKSLGSCSIREDVQVANQSSLPTSKYWVASEGQQ